MIKVIINVETDNDSWQKNKMADINTIVGHLSEMLYKYKESIVADEEKTCLDTNGNSFAHIKVSTEAE